MLWSDPDKGTELPKGDRVDLHVSLGPQPEATPTPPPADDPGNGDGNGEGGSLRGQAWVRPEDV